MPSDLDLVLRLLTATGLGAAVGVEREMKGQSAGLRTHLSVALGAALFSLAGVMAAPKGVDPTRIAAQVVTGIGFLGGGAILKQGPTVRGLTTAASLWVTAAIGTAAGLGLPLTATVSTAILLGALAGLRRPSRWIKRTLVQRRYGIELLLDDGASSKDVIDALRRMPGLNVRSVTVQRRKKSRWIVADVRLERGAEITDQLDELEARNDVMEADITE